MSTQFKYMPLQDGDLLRMESPDPVNVPLPHPGLFGLYRFALLQANLQAEIRASAEDASAEDDGPHNLSPEAHTQPSLETLDNADSLGRFMDGVEQVCMCFVVRSLP